MLPHISNSQPHLPGEDPQLNSVLHKQPLSGEQRIVLEKLMMQLELLTKKQHIDILSEIKQGIGIKNEAPLLSRHFSAAEQLIIHKLQVSGPNRSNFQLLSQLTGLMEQGRNSVILRDFIRAEYGYTALSQLSEDQIKTVLTLLQQEPRPATSDDNRIIGQLYLTKSEINLLRQSVTILANLTEDNEEKIWQSLLKFSGSPRAELISSGMFNHLSAWLHTRSILAGQESLTLQILQSVLKQTLKINEFTILKDYALDTYKIQTQTILTAVQVQEIINYIFRRRIDNDVYSVEPQSIQPIYNPVIPVVRLFNMTISLPKLILITLAIVALIFLFVF